ncbi:unnamed protein product, partial [Ectocarpus sp. 12 AP-2014]
MGRSRGRSGHLPAPVASVLQSPKDTPLEFFQDGSRPLSARMSDKPGGAFSGLRPTSFSIARGPARSRVSSIEEEDRRAGNQPLVSQSYSGGFGRSESSLGAGGAISSRRIAGSRSADRDGMVGGGGSRGRSGRGEDNFRRAGLGGGAGRKSRS